MHPHGKQTELEHAAAMGSTSNFELPAEELDKFAQDHNLNGGRAATSSTEDDDDSYAESLVYVTSPKVGWLNGNLHTKSNELCPIA